jgi:glycosyltransferase involved in cell wall biosynthesis
MDVDVSLFIQTLEIGGAQRVMVNLANGFAAEGYTTDLVLVTESGDFLEEVAADVRILDLGATRTVTSIPQLGRYLQNVEPLTMISAMTHTNVAALIANGVARGHTNIIVTEHADWTKRKKYNKEGMKNRLLAFTAGGLYSLSDHVVANSETVKQSITEKSRLSEDSIRMVPNPVVTNKLKRQKEGGVQEWFKKLEGPIVTSVGRLAPEKDYPMLLRAFQQLRNDLDASLLLIGDGQSRSGLEALAMELGVKEAVIFAGEMRNPFPYLARSSVFALPSISEAFGNVIVEAMACGCPVVTTRCSTGPVNILNDGEYGRLIPVGDTDAMSRALRTELLSPTKESVLQSRADDFSIETVLPMFEALL